MIAGMPERARLRGTCARGVLLVALLLACPTARAGDDAPDRPVVPAENTSFVPDANPEVEKAFREARAAADGGGDWSVAVRLLQGVIDARDDATSPGVAVSHVV